MKVIAMTGVTSGFGVSWLYQLDRSEDALFLILARDEQRFQQQVSTLPLKNRAIFLQCDLGSFESIRRALSDINKHVPHVDLLINNAGVWSNDNRPLSADGIELTLAVNLLAPYLLTTGLVDLLSKSDDARVVNTASFRHSDANVDREDIELVSNFSPELAYCNSKLFVILFTKSIAARLANRHITVNCFDPWIVDTPMLRQAFPKRLLFLYPLVKRLIARSSERGAKTGVFLSTSPNCNGQSGEYFRDDKLAKRSSLASDTGLENWLWNECVRLSGIEYIA